jgi:uncharacterized OsmC-like protein
MLTDVPELAQFKWRATNEWVKGTHSRTTFTDFSGLTQEHTHRQTYTIDADHPEIFASEDNGVTPVEVALAALASCLTGGVATVASNRNIQLRSVTATLQGTMDLQGMLGIDGEVRNGFGGIHVAFTIDADATEAEIEAVVAQSQKRSPVFDIISNPTTVTVGLA